MHSLTYERMFFEDDKDIPQLAMIYQLPEIARYLSIGDNYFRYVTSNKNVYFYKVYENNKLIGTTHLEKQGAVLYMDILVFPEFQGNWLGTRILNDIQNDIFELNFDRIEVSIDEENASSLRLFENAGFIRMSKDDELINFSYQRRID